MPHRGVIVAGNFQDIHWLRAAGISSASISAWTWMVPVVGLLCNACPMPLTGVALIGQAPTTSKQQKWVVSNVISFIVLLDALQQ